MTDNSSSRFNFRNENYSATVRLLMPSRLLSHHMVEIASAVGVLKLSVLGTFQ